MTQFQPPPEGPPSPFVPNYTSPVGQTPKWSAAAISGFVLSLLGCTGIGAVLGLILGIVGIVRTRGGRRRGLGFAIAAIPISVIMGLVSIAAGMGMLMAARAAALMTQLPAVFAADPAATAGAVGTLRELCSDDFNEAVSTEQLGAWIERTTAKHGRLVEILPPAGGAMAPGSSGEPILSLPGKFVNGTVNVKITISQHEVAKLRFAIDDIEVDGSSPRRFDLDPEPD